MVYRNVLIISNTGSGKTSYIQKLRECFPFVEHPTDYGSGKTTTFEIPDLGKVNVLDSNAVETDVYDVAIIMCAEEPVWIEEYKRRIEDMCGDIPVRILFNKDELPGVKKNYHQYTFENPHESVWRCSVHDKDGNGGVKETFLEIITE